VSQLVDAASGIHARHNEYYIRTVRADRKDPICQFMIDQGFPAEPCVMRPDHTMVFSFPMKSPDGSPTRNDLTAIEHLELWKKYQDFWCEHKPSVTITVREPEWLDVGAWVYKYIDSISGISFLPHSEHSYKQAPYQDCTKEEYEAMLSRMPKNVDWSLLSNYEKEDTTTGTQTFACNANSCEIVDLTQQ
jgi:ribonucleoside-diphosphate reductase alpha chain